jgi:hypothetical protein
MLVAALLLALALLLAHVEAAPLLLPERLSSTRLGTVAKANEALGYTAGASGLDAAQIASTSEDQEHWTYANYDVSSFRDTCSLCKKDSGRSREARFAELLLAYSLPSSWARAKIVTSEEIMAAISAFPHATAIIEPFPDRLRLLSKTGGDISDPALSTSAHNMTAASMSGQLGVASNASSISKDERGADVRSLQQQQQQPHMAEIDADRLVAAAAAAPSPAPMGYEGGRWPLQHQEAVPLLVHITIKNKTAMLPHQAASVASWAKLNPGYVIVLYDDVDIRCVIQTQVTPLGDGHASCSIGRRGDKSTNHRDAYCTLPKQLHSILGSWCMLSCS